jgi:hypothetical protein
MAEHNLARASGPRRSAPKLSSRDTAAYARDLLESLKIIALRQRQRRLAELLDAAAQEAQRLAREQLSQPLRKGSSVARMAAGTASKLKFKKSRDD